MKTIYTKIGNWTGLGNQLFQYATLKIKAILNNCDFVIQTDNYCQLGMFEYFRNYQKIVNEIPSDLKVIKERVQTYDEEFDKMEINNSIIIEGYFQSKKYFHKYKELVRLLFKFDNQTLRDTIDWRSQYKDVVCIHIRLPDVKNEDKRYWLYSIPTKEYIRDALKEFDKNNVFAIFSNNIEWSRELFGDILSEYNCEFIVGDKENDLCKMSMCDAYILTSSTFGWWGWYLNEKENCKVVSCRPFFNLTAHGAHLNDLYDKDYYEKDWKLISLQ